MTYIDHVENRTFMMNELYVLAGVHVEVRTRCMTVLSFYSVSSSVHVDFISNGIPFRTHKLTLTIIRRLSERDPNLALGCASRLMSLASRWALYIAQCS